jgi:phosphoserine aminotransferase
MGLVFKWIKRNGGTEGMQEQAKRKSGIIYDVISSSNNFYYCPVKSAVRSQMNIPFRIGGTNGNDDLEKEFLSGAQKLGMLQLKGHRYVVKKYMYWLQSPFTEYKRYFQGHKEK